MNDTPIRPEVVSHILDLILDGPPSNWTHRDGRPATPEDVEIVMDATFKELETVLDHSRRALEYTQERETATRRVLELTGPYFATAGPGAVMADIRPLMTHAEIAELDQLSDFLAPDGTIVWQAQA